MNELQSAYSLTLCGVNVVSPSNPSHCINVQRLRLCGIKRAGSGGLAFHAYRYVKFGVVGSRAIAFSNPVRLVGHVQETTELAPTFHSQLDLFPRPVIDYFATLHEHSERLWRKWSIATVITDSALMLPMSLHFVVLTGIALELPDLACPL